jgi:Tfp pilus assembly protein PilO
MDFKKREYILFYAIAGLLGIWLISSVIFAPFHSRLAELARSVTVQESKYKKGVSLLAIKEEINKAYERYATYFSVQGYSDEETIASFLKAVEKISRESGLTILDMKPQKESKSDKYSKQYQINIKAEGHMQEFINFLYALHDAPLLFSIEKMTIAPKSEDSPDLSITLTMVGISFV